MAGETLILGITADNVERLKAGQPINVDIKEMGIYQRPISNIVIVYAINEQELFKLLKPNIHPTRTIIKSDRAGEN